VSPPRNDCAGRLGGQPARGSRYEKEDDPKNTKFRRRFLLEQAGSLRQVAVTHLPLIDLRISVAGVLDQISRRIA
jgi:hypothetical protein